MQKGTKNQRGHTERYDSDWPWNAQPLSRRKSRCGVHAGTRLHRIAPDCIKLPPWGTLDLGLWTACRVEAKRRRMDCATSVAPNRAKSYMGECAPSAFCILPSAFFLPGTASRFQPLRPGYTPTCQATRRSTLATRHNRLIPNTSRARWCRIVDGSLAATRRCR